MLSVLPIHRLQAVFAYTPECGSQSILYTGNGKGDVK